MEMPIQIIMTLFVVLVVGILLIFFSQNLINQADTELTKKNNPVEGTQIVEISSLSSSQIAPLVEECYRTHMGKVFKDEICFIIHSNTAYTISSNDINSALVNKDALVRVNDDGLLTKNVIVKWKFIDAKVEVSS